MIREATIDDAARIAEIDVFSSRYAYKRILSEECFLWKEPLLSGREREDIQTMEQAGNQIYKNIFM